MSHTCLRQTDTCHARHLLKVDGICHAYFGAAHRMGHSHPKTPHTLDFKAPLLPLPKLKGKRKERDAQPTHTGAYLWLPTQASPHEDYSRI